MYWKTEDSAGAIDEDLEKCFKDVDADLDEIRIKMRSNIELTRSTTNKLYCAIETLIEHKIVTLDEIKFQWQSFSNLTKQECTRMMTKLQEVTFLPPKDDCIITTNAHAKTMLTIFRVVILSYFANDEGERQKEEEIFFASIADVYNEMKFCLGTEKHNLLQTSCPLDFVEKL